MTHCIHAPRDTSMQTDCGCGNRVTDLRKARRSQTFLHHAGQLDRRFASTSSSSSFVECAVLRLRLAVSRPVFSRVAFSEKNKHVGLPDWSL